MRIFDTHAHYDSRQFNENRDELLKIIYEATGESERVPVRRIINVGADMASSQTTLELSQKYDHIFAAVGVHPDSAGELIWCPEKCAKYENEIIDASAIKDSEDNLGQEIGNADDSDTEDPYKDITEEICNRNRELLRNLAQQKKVVAIGEIGLDYHWDIWPRDIQKKTVDERYMENGRAIEKQQESHNRNQAWSTDISLDRRMERDELEFLQDVITNQDENLFYVALYAVVSADSLSALERSVTTFMSTAEGEGFRFRPASQNQLEALNTALPTGARFATHMYPLLAQPLAALTPFTVHELNDPDGLFYGINQISKNVLVGNRKLLTNPHGFILGKTGGGKGFATKLEVLQVLLKPESPGHRDLQVYVRKNSVSP